MAKRLLSLFILLCSIQLAYSQNFSLLSPNGGEVWQVGSQQHIQWAYSNVSFFKIEYSIDGGQNYTTIVGSTEAYHNGYYWIVPNTASNNCFIRLTDLFGGTSKVNPLPFSIVVQPFITVTSPNGGEVLTPNTVTAITWYDTLSIPTVNIDISIDGGINWASIVSNYPNNHTYNWTVPNTSSTFCYIRVSSAQDSSVFDISNGNFTINMIYTPIHVDYPNGFESLPTGYPSNIYYTANNIDNVKIEYSEDLGNTWTTLTYSYPGNAVYFPWASPGPNVTNSALIRVSDVLDPGTYDVSDFPFSLFAGIPFLDLMSPNGGELLGIGSTYNIQWNAFGSTLLDIFYSVNNGASWNPVASNVSSVTGSYQWTVPNTPSTNVLIKINDVSDPSKFDQSNSTFSIVNPSLNFQFFPSATVFEIFSLCSFSWSSTGLSQNQLLNLEYTPDNGLNWFPIASNVPNSGSYSWYINCPPIDSCKVRISLQNDPSIYTISPGAIKIMANSPAIFVLAPSSMEVLGSGTIYPIKWFSYGMQNVRIEYITNLDTLLHLITPLTSAQNGVYYWHIPANLVLSNCKIRISNAANTAFSGTSNVFMIQPGNINITSGNISTTLVAGITHQIKWTSQGINNYVNLYYSTDNINWQPIVSNYSNNGVYDWFPPYIASNTLWYKVEDAFNNLMFDTNDAVLQIVIGPPLMEIVQPASGSAFVTGSMVNIVWNIEGVSHIDIKYSDNGGGSWTTIASNVDASLNNYNWTIPTNAINNGLLRISNSANALQYDEISFVTDEKFTQITTPNGGETWNTSNNHYISWQSVGVDFVNIYYSNDGGNNYTVIDTNVYNHGSYNWLTPGSAGTNYRIKITDSNDSNITTSSASNFSLSNVTPSLTLTSPNGGEEYYANTPIYITWQANTLFNCDISYSIDGGITYIPIASNISSIPAYYYWVTPNSISSTVKIKISKSGTGVTLFDESDANFSINSNIEQLTLLSPNGGLTYFSNSFQTIKWKAINCNMVNLYYTKNNGTTYYLIATVINDSSYVWNVPAGSTSNSCKIKVESGTNSSVFDLSDALFTIYSMAYTGVTITFSPLADNTLCSGQSFPLSFTSSITFNNGNTFRVQLSDINGNFTNFTEIGSIVSTTGTTINCTIPENTPSGTAYKLRLVGDKPVISPKVYNLGSLIIRKGNSAFNASQQLLLLPSSTVSLTPIPNNPNLIANSLWNTGDNTSYNTFSVQHSYSHPGKYDITHTVTDTGGCSASVLFTRYIDVEHWFPNETVLLDSISNFKDIAFENKKYGALLINDGNCYVTSDSGKTWTLNYTAYGNVKLNSINMQNSTWYITTENGTLLRSTNKGATWGEVSFSNTNSLNDINFITPSLAYAVGNNGKIIKFNGSTWKSQSSGISQHLKQIDSNHGTIIAVGNQGTILKLNNNTWSTINSPVNVNFNAIALKDSANGYIATQNGFILKSTNAGLNWNIVLSGADVNFTSVALSGDTVWCGASNGIVYYSVNHGQSWIRTCIGVNNKDINQLIYQNNKGYIVGNSGLFRTFGKHEFVPVVDNIKEVDELKDIICYPNPIENMVNIVFNKNNYIKYNITIVDLNGKTVMQKQISAASSAQIDMSDLKAGVYFLSLNNNNYIRTFKLIKAK